MRILHLTIGLSIGGAERALVDLAVAQRACGHDTAVLAVRRGGPIADELQRCGVPCAWPGAPASAWRALHRRPALVHGHLFSADVAALGAARAHGIPAVTTLHSTVEGYALSPLRRRVARALYPRFDVRVAVSGAVADSFARELAVSATVVPNAVRHRVPDEAELAAARAALPAGRIVLAVGRLIGSKGFSVAAGALARLPADVSLVVAGEGPERDAIAAAAAGAAGRLHFLGTRSDVPALLACADALVLPSTVEGSPVVVVEAMQAGCPVVATRAGGLAEMLEGCPVAALAQPEVDEVAAGIAGALDPARAEAFRKWAVGARARYAPETVVRALDELYAAARETRRGRP